MNDRFPQVDIVATGWKIKMIMDAKGLSVKDVQKYLKLSSPQSIYHWIEGRNMPTIDNLYALSELFDMSIDSMIVGNRRIKQSKSEIIRLLEYYKRIAS